MDAKSKKQIVAILDKLQAFAMPKMQSARKLDLMEDTARWLGYLAAITAISLEIEK